MKHLFFAFLLMFMPMMASAGAVGDIFTAYANGLNMRCKITSSTTIMLYGEYGSGSDDLDYFVNEWSSCLVDYNIRTVDDDGDVLTCCRYKGSVSIPEKILNPNDGLFYVITKIGEYAFGHADGITSITLPSSITEISAHAFEFCFNLPSISMPETVTTIGDYAFYNSGLKTLDIPVGVKFIGKGAFRGCANLSSAVIPPDITEIEEFLFYDCSNLTEVTLGSAVETIGRSSFGNSSLTSIVLPESVTTIDDYAFANCKGLTDVYCLPENIPATQTNSFMSSNVENATLHVPGALIKYYKAIEPWSYFKKIVASDGPLEEGGIYYNLNEDTKTVAVTYGSYTGDLVIPSEVDLGEIYTVTEIAESAFGGCGGLTSVTIPNTVTTIGNNAFCGCSGLTSIVIPSSVTSIGEGAFWGCRGLTSLSIPNSITSISDYTFRDCSNLITMTIPNSVTSIGQTVFAGCSSLTSINIPNSVTSIGGAVFSDCINLTSVSIPNTVTSIGDFLFYKCTNLMSVTSNITEPYSVNSNVFSTVTYRKGTLYIPVGTEKLYIRFDGWREFLNIMEIGSASNIRGDLNNDGKVDAADVVELVNIIMGE